MQSKLLALSAAMGVVAMVGGAHAASCNTDAVAIEHDVRTGDPLTVHVREAANPSLGGALAPARSGAAVVDVSRIPIEATLGEKIDALEALEQAQIYGAIGEESACQIALHEALRHLNVYQQGVSA